MTTDAYAAVIELSETAPAVLAFLFAFVFWPLILPSFIKGIVQRIEAV